MAADLDLAGLPLRNLDSVQVDHPHLDTLDRGADRARLAGPVRMIERGRRRTLGKPVALENGAAESLFEVGENLDGQRRATGNTGPQTARRLRRGIVCHAEQRRIHRRHPLEYRDGVTLDHLERLARVEPGNERQRRTREHGTVEPAGQAEDVEQRQAAHHHVVRPGLDEGADADLSVAAQIAVGEHGALGLSGGAGGVQDDRDVFVVALHR